MIEKNRNDNDLDSDEDAADLEEDGDMFPTSGQAQNLNKRARSDSEDSDANSVRENVTDQSVSGTSQKSKKKLKKLNEQKKLTQPPTVEELNRLRETENLFHSNLFRRQIEEMLKELEMKNKLKIRVNTWFNEFKNWIEKMEDSSERRNLSDSEVLSKLDIRVPLSASKLPTKGSYLFKRPRNTKLVGAYNSKTLMKFDAVEINVTMPSQFFDKEDYLNGRYYFKRALYLCELAKHITKKSDLVQEIKFTKWDDDNNRPALELTPTGKLSGKINFVINLVAEASSFRLSRFNPTTNNVRSQWLLDGKSDEPDKECPTPIYNSGILRDLRSDSNDAFIYEVVSGSSQLRDAVVLLKVWAKQRDLLAGLCSEQLLTFVVAYLLHIRKVHVTMSSYQIIRAVWNYLGGADWRTKGITMCTSSGEQQPSLDDFHRQFSLVFIDPSGFLNLCAGICWSALQRWQDEASQAVKSLDTPDINCFQVLFMVPAPFSRLCDHTLVFNNWTALEKVSRDRASPKMKLNYCNQQYLQVREQITELLVKSLGFRAHRVIVSPVSKMSWALKKKPRISSHLTVGIILDPDFCFSLIEKGPEADAKEAEAFRSFWKGRSELRRFKDGSITESVVWSGTTWAEKRMICRQICNYVLETHWNLTGDKYLYLGDELESMLPADWENKCSRVVNAYDTLAKHLRRLTDLPLDVISTQGASPVFRRSEMFPPELALCRISKKAEKRGNCLLVDERGHQVPPWCAAALVILQLGSSNKWPKDLEAVRRIRAAFNIKLAELLTKKCNYVTHPFVDWVDVLTDVCVFRLRIVYPGEIGLMKKIVSPDGVVSYRDNKQSLQLERVAVQLPNLTSALNGLGSVHNSYGGGCCLAKRWVRAHLFHERHISDEALDLLVAAAYVNPDPWRPPHQPQLAFIRFISLLALTDWNIQCILLNFNQVLTNEEKQEIERKFEKNRDSLPCLFIATPDERERSVWTQDGPTPVVLHRLAALAARTLTLLSSPHDNLQWLMQPSTSVFDALIQLKSASVPRRHEAVAWERTSSSEDNKEIPSDVIPVTDFDPPESFIKELEASFSEWALFFYDPYGGQTIGVLWKPSEKSRPLKVTHLHGRSWQRSDNTLHLNTPAILQAFYVLGKGLVNTVQWRMPLDKKDCNSYMDGVPVKVTEKYKRRPVIRLPTICQNCSPGPALSEQYNFQVERNLLSKLERWKEIRQEQVNELEEKCRKWKQVEEEIEKLNPMLTVEQSKCQLLAPQVTSSNGNASSTANPFNEMPLTILQPTDAPRNPSPNTHKDKPNHFKISDFETDNSSPFDNMALKTINDMEVLASVLSSQSGGGPSNAVNTTYHASSTAWNGYATYSSPQPHYYTPSQYDCPPMYSSMYHSPSVYPYSPPPIPSTFSNLLPYTNNNHHHRIHGTKQIETADVPLQPLKSSSKSVPDLVMELEKEMKDYRISDELKRKTKTPPPQTNTASVGFEDWQPWPEVESPRRSSDDILARNISEMGFPLERVLRSIDKFSGDDKKVQRLEEKRFKGDLVERALHVNNYNDKETEKHLEAGKILLDLGFDVDVVEKALLDTNNDRDAALDRLIS